MKYMVLVLVLALCATAFAGLNKKNKFEMMGSKTLQSVKRVADKMVERQKREALVKKNIFYKERQKRTPQVSLTKKVKEAMKQIKERRNSLV